MLHAAAPEVTDELEREKDQDLLQDELDCSCEHTATAAREFSNCWAAPEVAIAKTSSDFREICNRRVCTHVAIRVEARKAWQRTYDLKREASEAQESVFSHRVRTRRFSHEHARAGLFNDALGSLGQAVRAAAQATYSLTCGVPDRESNEIKYLREATEVTERWQQQLQDGQPVNKVMTKLMGRHFPRSTGRELYQ